MPIRPTSDQIHQVPTLISMHRLRILLSLAVISTATLSGVWICLRNSANLSFFAWDRNPSAAISSFSWETHPPSRSLQWRNCYPDRQCARLIVPLNYSDPLGQEAIIAIIRKPSRFSESSKFYGGPILFNPGGPGGSGVDLVQGRTGDLLSTIVGPRFDVVSFDPRGIGRSTPRASFFESEVERALWEHGLKGLNVVNNSDEGIARTWARSHVIGKLAAGTDNGYLRHINTDNTARDMLSIVLASGRTKIQYWGFSYGSILGATFAAMFPDRIERLVIDGVVDSENYYGAFLDNNLRDTDTVLQSFFTDCSEAGPLACSFWASTPEEISRNLTSLYDSVRAKPLPVRTTSSYGVVDISTLRSAIFTSLYSPYSMFQTLAKGLAELAAGDGRIIYDMVWSPPYQCSCTPEPSYNNVREALTAVACNDGNDIPSDLEYSQEYFKAFSEISNWADLWAGVRMSCVGWPEFPKDHFQGPFEANTSHPILLIGNTAGEIGEFHSQRAAQLIGQDPVTPLWAANKMSRGFEKSVVLTQDSTGHCSISAPSLCTQKYIRQYFADGSLPEPGTVCESVGDPFPASPIEESRQEAFAASLSVEEQGIYNAISELSLSPVISVPFLGVNPGIKFRIESGCS